MRLCWSPGPARTREGASVDADAAARACLAVVGGDVGRRDQRVLVAARGDRVQEAAAAGADEMDLALVVARVPERLSPLLPIVPKLA